MTNTVSDKLTA